MTTVSSQDGNFWSYGMAAVAALAPVHALTVTDTMNAEVMVEVSDETLVIAARTHGDLIEPLSPEAAASLRRGIESGRTDESVYLGSFAKYADDE